MKIIKSVIISLIMLVLNFVLVNAQDPTETPTPTKTPGFTQTPIGTYVPTATSVYSENPEIPGCPIFTPGAETDLSWYYECSDCLSDPTQTPTITPTGYQAPTATPTVNPMQYWSEEIDYWETSCTSSGGWQSCSYYKYLKSRDYDNNIIVAFAWENSRILVQSDNNTFWNVGSDSIPNGAVSKNYTGSLRSNNNACIDSLSQDGDGCTYFGRVKTNSTSYQVNDKATYFTQNYSRYTGSATGAIDKIIIMYYGIPPADPTPTPTPEICTKPAITIGESYQTYGMNEVIYQDGVFWEQYGNDVENVWADININSEKVTEIKFISGTNDFLPVYLETEIQLYDHGGNLISQCRRESGCTNGLTITSDLFNEYTKINSASEISVDKIRIILNNFSYVHIDYIDVTGCKVSENSKCMFPEQSPLDPILNFSGISYAETKCTLLLPESIEFDKVNDLLPAGWEPLDNIYLIANGITVCFDLVNLPTVTILGFTISVTFVLNVLYVVMIWQWFMAMLGVK